MSPNAKASLLMTLSMAAFTLNDTCIKLVGESLPLFQLLVLRATLASALIYLLARSQGALHFRLSPGDRWLLALRCLGEVSATWLFLQALIRLPLANVTAILQTLPLTVTLGAALLFGERVGWRRSVAIAAGFAGMLLIVRPGAEGVDVYSFYALGAVACVTLRDLATRRMSPAAPSLSVTLISSLAVLLFAALGSIGIDWQPVGGRNAALICASAVFIAAGYLLSILVMRVGEVSASAPFRYTGLVWALALGWLIFGHWPDRLTLVGAAVVAGSGLFALHRQQRRAQPAAPARRGC